MVSLKQIEPKSTAMKIKQNEVDICPENLRIHISNEIFQTLFPT